jgi:hypothetical protein
LNSARMHLRCMSASTDHPQAAKRPSRQRSAVTNGRRSFIEGDGRSPWARRRRDLEMVYSEDLGGLDVLTGYQQGLVQAAATLRVEMEALEGKLSMGEQVELEAYARIASHYRRIVESLGIERRQRDVTPNLADIIARHNRSEEAE